MQYMWTLLFILNAFFAPLTHDLNLSGKVYFENAEDQKKVQGLFFFVKDQKGIIATDYINEDGKYSFSINEDLIINGLDFYYAGNGFDTTFVTSLLRFESDVSTVDFQLMY